MKPVIIAICGASASGKDYLLKALAPALGATVIVSDTTRPIRDGEQQGIDYNFIDQSTFLYNLHDNQYLEWTCFRNWYYGTNKDDVCGKINIGVFNLEGIISLYLYKDKYTILPIYLKVSPVIRIKRYIKREGKFSLECVRRFLADIKQFWNADIYLSIVSPQYLVLKNFKTDEKINNLVQDIMYNRLSDYYF